MKLSKKAFLLLLAFTFIFSSIPVLAASNDPVIYKETITLDANGGRFQIGFVNVEFKKDFLDDELLPATFDIEIYAENGVGYISFSPDTPKFNKKVHIRVDSYKVLLYDKATNQNIKIHIPKQQILAEHFSAYAFHRR